MVETTLLSSQSFRSGFTEDQVGDGFPSLPQLELAASYALCHVMWSHLCRHITLQIATGFFFFLWFLVVLNCTVKGLSREVCSLASALVGLTRTTWTAVKRRELTHQMACVFLHQTRFGRRVHRRDVIWRHSERVLHFLLLSIAKRDEQQWKTHTFRLFN